MDKKSFLKAQNIWLLLIMYGFWVVVFAIQKPVFMICNKPASSTFSDWIEVIVHGLKLDCCVAAYPCLLPILVLLVCCFFGLNPKKFIKIYSIVFACVVATVFATDCVLFSYWGFHLDATLVFYLHDGKDALSSVTLPDVGKFLLILLPYLCLMVATIVKLSDKIEPIRFGKKGILTNTIVLVLFIPVFYIVSRGGVSTASANIGMVYYSQNQSLNLAAVNPLFSFAYSTTKQEDFANEYRYMSEEECKKTFDSLLYAPQYEEIWGTKDKMPDVLVIIWESLSANAVECVGGQYSKIDSREITPGLNALAKESIVFTNCYSNAMRTDRGVVSVLTGFLAQPNTSIIKYPQKTRSLPSLAKVFKQRKYSTSMLYGGDIDFANMRSYFVSTGYEKLFSDKDFPIEQRLSKWGVNDKVTFDFLLKQIQKEKKGHKFFKTFLTLSSHEPFDVDMKRFKDPYANSLAYTDSCLYEFIGKLKKTEQWKNLIVVVVADHGYKYPGNLADNDPRKYHIPMIWTGGAIEKPARVERYVNQTDIPSSLLHRYAIDCSEFEYSRDVFNPRVKNYAFYVYNNGFGFIDETGLSIFDCNANKSIGNRHDKAREKKGKALLQTLYRDIANR